MSRFDYGDSDWTENECALYEANVNRCLRGKRGQAWLRELHAALLAMPEHKLISGTWAESGGVCALGAVAAHRLVEAEKVTWQEAVKRIEEQFGQDTFDEYSSTHLAVSHLHVHRMLAQRTAWMNDEYAMGSRDDLDEIRWNEMLAWVERALVEVA